MATNLYCRLSHWPPYGWLRATCNAVTLGLLTHGVKNFIMRDVGNTCCELLDFVFNGLKSGRLTAASDDTGSRQCTPVNEL